MPAYELVEKDVKGYSLGGQEKEKAEKEKPMKNREGSKEKEPDANDSDEDDEYETEQARRARYIVEKRKAHAGGAPAFMFDGFITTDPARKYRDVFAAQPGRWR
jgi:hypothetical protein